MATVQALLEDATLRLRDKSESPRLDAELLLGHVLNETRTWLFTWPEKAVPRAQVEAFEFLLRRRELGEPVAWLLGEREFYGYRFRVTPATLIPRPDTELLVEALLERLPDNEPMKVVDLGTGTGAVGISLALERPDWHLLLTDIDEDCVVLATENARRLGALNVEVGQSDWLDRVEGTFDAIVANPPYVAENDPNLNEGDVRFEPRRALVSGPDGLDAIRRILIAAPLHLVPGGVLAMEHGYEQGEAVWNLFEDAGFHGVETHKDLAGLDRVTLGRRNP